MFRLNLTIIRQTFQYMDINMFSAHSMGSQIVCICCVEFRKFGLINCSTFNILSNVFPEIKYRMILSM